MKSGGNVQNDQWIRDLRWVMSSPFLMSSDGLGEENSTAIEGLELNERQAAMYSEKYSGHRVGYYFESLVFYWLKHVRGVEILAHSYQVLDEGRTVGELDFVFRDEEAQVVHWEVAAKFYLYCVDEKVKGSHYIGPNARDTFELKKEKIIGKQLPLSKVAFPEVSCRQAFVKGRIFYHPQQSRPDVLPDGLLKNHQCGMWLRFSEISWLDDCEKSKKMMYHLIKKPFWLAPECLSSTDESIVEFRELKDYLEAHFSEQKFPVLLSVLIQEEGLWRENNRVFVVADDWPAI